MASSPAPRPLAAYTEFGDMAASLPTLLREARVARGLTMRAVARQMGMSHSTICRIEQGDDCSLANAAVVFWWLGQGVR